MNNSKSHGNKDALIKFRVSQHDKQEIKKQAQRNGMEISEYIRQLIELDRQGGILCKK